MILKQGIAVVVLAAIALRGCLSNPLPTQAADAQSGCTDGTIKLGLPLNCAQTTAPTTLAVDNETLARLQCDAMALRQRALNFCIQHSTVSVSTHNSSITIAIVPLVWHLFGLLRRDLRNYPTVYIVL